MADDPSTLNQTRKTTMSPTIVQDRCWTIPVVAAFSVFFVMLTSSSFGLLYVLFMSQFNVNHEQATWPQSIYVPATHVVGLLTTVLQQKVPVYYMTLLGATLVDVSLVTSSFASNIVWMSVLVGAAYGAGAGIVIITLSLYALTYFDKYRATATAFKYVGCAASGVVGPSLLAYTSENYGSLPALLLMGAIAARSIPLVMLLKNPRPLGPCVLLRKKFCPVMTEQTISTSISNSCNGVFPSDYLLPGDAAGDNGGNHSSLPLQMPIKSLQKAKGSMNIENMKLQDFNNPHAGAAQTSVQDAPGASAKSIFFFEDTNHVQCQGNYPRRKYLVVKAPDMVKHCCVLFRSAYLYALVAVYVAVDYSSSMHEGTIVAYGIYKHAGTLSNCNQLQTSAALGMLAGRIVVPVLSDKIPNSRCPLAAGSLAVSAASLVLMSFTSEYVIRAVLTTTLGACRGFLLCVKAVLYGDYLGVESLSFACGLQGLGMVPVLLTAPAVIGFFRNEMGSYDPFYWTLATMNIAAASIVFCLALTDKQRRKQWRLSREQQE